MDLLLVRLEFVL
uniref:Uncharacterized protein n=1 Tax=Arundo donax TaxID=35708 RepID=A0A0A8ZYU8_ARUDO